MNQTVNAIDQLEKINESLELGTKQGQQQIQDLQQLQSVTMAGLAQLKSNSQATLDKVQTIQPPKPENSPSDRAPIIFAVTLAGLGGLIVGIALGSSYVAPLL